MSFSEISLQKVGPYFRHKLKSRHSTEKIRETHKNHIHFSINELMKYIVFTHILLITLLSACGNKTFRVDGYLDDVNPNRQSVL